MTKCKNCGHDSHCGVPKYGERLDFIDVPPTRYEICKQCRCSKCEVKTDWG